MRVLESWAAITPKQLTCRTVFDYRMLPSAESHCTYQPLLWPAGITFNPMPLYTWPTWGCCCNNVDKQGSNAKLCISLMVQLIPGIEQQQAPRHASVTAKIKSARGGWTSRG